MKTIKGDILSLAEQGNFDVIVHGCNCVNSMKGALSTQIKENYPAVIAADDQTESASVENKLGTVSGANVTAPGTGHRFTILNGYTQAYLRGPGILADYDAIRSVFRIIKKNFTGKRIAYPMIGAGGARGDWDTIAAIINEELAGEDHTLVEFDPQSAPYFVANGN